MKSVYTYNPWNNVEFLRERGHMMVAVHMFSPEGNPTKIQIAFDTGAYITVLTRMNAQLIGLPLTGEYMANLTGFNIKRGSDKAEIVIVPKIEIGKYIVENVQVLVPLEEIVISEVLGENVLEYFIYTVDNDADRIFFSKNPNPKPYKDYTKGIDLSCGRVLAQG